MCHAPGVSCCAVGADAGSVVPAKGVGQDLLVAKLWIRLRLLTAAGRVRSKAIGCQGDTIAHALWSIVSSAAPWAVVTRSDAQALVDKSWRHPHHF